MSNKNITSVFQGIREYWTPVLTESKFRSHAVLTPEEFVIAGDFLVFKCGTWRWESGDPSKRKDYLPADKQFLTTKNVPCFKRVREMEYLDYEQNVEGGEDADDAWVATHMRPSRQEGEDDEKEESDIDMLDDLGMTHQPTKSTTKNDDDEIPDMDDAVYGVVDTMDTMTIPNKIVKTRTYDLTVSYDKYYQTPRLSLYGFDELGAPLQPMQMLQDISQDHANKTVTIEPHPHIQHLQVASIHPCKHAHVMLKIMDKLAIHDKVVRVDQYLIVFLKFMASVIPTIDYDHTMSLQ